MTAINLTVFTDKILRGLKRQTIRKIRTAPINVGTKLQLYTGLRTSGCVKLGDTVCSATHKVTVSELTFPHKERWRIYLDHVLLTKSEATQFAFDDGFDSVDNFCEFFKRQYGLPFHGVVIKWGELKQ